MIMSETLKSNAALEDDYRAMADDEEREAEALDSASSDEPEAAFVWPRSDGFFDL